MSVHQLIYSSSAGKKMLKPDLYMILRHARKNNEARDITGLLVYSEENFLQILEGEKEAVSQLFDTISKDDRHSNIQVLHDSEIEQRSFSNWTMAFATPSAKQLAQWAGLHNTTTVAETLSSLKSQPNRVTEVISNLLEKSELS